LKISAVLTTIPSDSHCWNLVFMQMFMEENGIAVENLGICVPFDEVVARCRAGEPDLVVVSTVNGHGYLEGSELANRLAALPDRDRFGLVIGGKLGIDSSQDAAHAAALRQAGYDAVFHGHDALVDFKDYLAAAAVATASAGSLQVG
jgi:methylaspartate mutase sigma subunit